MRKNKEAHSIISFFKYRDIKYYLLNDTNCTSNNSTIPETNSKSLTMYLINAKSISPIGWLMATRNGSNGMHET
jgi:hypothetical protein